MTFKDLLRTFEILSKYGGEYICDWAEHDEYGYGDINFPLTIEEIKELRNMGWLLGSSYEGSNEEKELWYPDSEKGKNATDEQIMNLWNKYKSIYKFA